MRTVDKSTLLAATLIVGFGIAAYWNSLDGVFLYDDVDSIVENPHIRRLWPLSEAMSLPLWSAPVTVAARPILSLTFALNHAIFGPAPRGYHVVNLLIHLCAGLLLFGIVRRTAERVGGQRSEVPPSSRQKRNYGVASGGRRSGRSSEAEEGVRHSSFVIRHSTAIALAVAVLWVVHPLNSEAVTYIVTRSESLMGMFFFLTLYASLRAFESSRCQVSGVRCQEEGAAEARRAPGVRQQSQQMERGGPPPHGNAPLWHTVAILACALGMGTKQVMFTAPLLVFLYDFVFVAGSFRRALRARWGFYIALAATAVYPVCTIFAQPGYVAENTAFASPVYYLLTQPGVILYYLRLVAWPHPLVLDYVWPRADGLLQIAPSLVVVAALAGGTILGLHRRSWLGYIGAWLFLTLAPSSSILPQFQYLREYRMYLPLAAVLVLVVVGVGKIGGRKSEVGGRKSGLPALWVGAMVVVAVALTWRTWDRNLDYHSRVRIWSDNVRWRPGSATAHNNLGQALLRTGRLAESIGHFRSALRIRPDFPEALVNMGGALVLTGNPGEAEAYSRHVLSMKPDSVAALCNLGVALLDQGNLVEAVETFRNVLRLNARVPEAHSGLGEALLEQGKPTEAEAHLREALRLDPGSTTAHRHLGILLLRRRDFAGAADHFRQVIQRRPFDAMAHTALARALKKQGDTHSALVHYAQALQHAANYPPALNDMAWIRATSPDPTLRDGRAAVALAQRLCGIADHPSPVTRHPSPPYLDTLAAAYAEAGRFEEAVETAVLAAQKATASGNTAWAERIEGRLELYRKAKPFRE